MVTFNKQEWRDDDPNADALKFYGEGSCLSSDSKPTENLINGSTLLEMDTGKVYMFDEANEQWREWGA